MKSMAEPAAAELSAAQTSQVMRKLDRVIAEMGGLAELHLAESVDALLKRDTEKARQIIAADQLIDDLETQLESYAVDVLTGRRPDQRDTRSTISALRTASLLERIGDYCKNIAKRSVVLSQSSPMGPAQSVGRMASLAQGMIKTVLDAYLDRDVKLAEDVRRRDADVDLLHTSLFREILTYMMEDPRNITPCTHLLFVAKNVERIGDHATNIAENVIFLVTGAPPAEEREKEDTSSYTLVRTGLPDKNLGPKSD